MASKHKVLLVLCLVLLSLGALLLLPRSSREKSDFPTTYSVAPEGCKALYLVLGELGLSTKRQRRSFAHLGTGKGVLVMA
ncbi:hypothetical protein ACFL2Q_19450, partial [Thermodesulfobacteriota bacterium]